MIFIISNYSILKRIAINVENKQSAQAELDYWIQVQQTRQATVTPTEEVTNTEQSADNTEVNEVVNTSEQPNDSNNLNDTTSSETNQSNGQEYKLSDEVDENGRQFVLSSNGDIVFGEITEETGLASAPILLSEGVITNDKTNDGYGLVHIEARHGKQIRDAGYKSVIEFIEEVAKNYEIIKEGIKRDGQQTYMLQLTDKHNNTLMVELSGDGIYWNINTAGIFKTSYGKNKKEVYNRHTTAKQPTETVGVSQTDEQSGTTSDSSMSTPTSSTAKGRESVSNKQENKGENTEKKKQ